MFSSNNQFAVLTIYSLLFIAVVGFIYFYVKPNSKLTKENKSAPETPKKKEFKFEPKFKSNSDIKLLLDKINVVNKEIPFSLWRDFDDHFTDQTEREMGLHCIELLINKITNEKKVLKFDRQRKKLNQLKQASKKRKGNWRRAKKELNEYQMKLNNKMKEYEKKVCEFINFSKTFDIYGMNFELNKDLKKKLKLKHVLSLWKGLKDRSTFRDYNCVICQFNINEGCTPIKLDCCGVELHFDCQQNYINSKMFKKGDKVSLNELGCLICKKKVHNDHLGNAFDPLNKLHDKLLLKYKKRLKFDERSEDDIDYAARKYIYYICYKCDEPYFGGLNLCQEQNHNKIPNEKRLCSKCDQVKGYEKSCKKHGTDFIQWKCKFCCSVATWDCGCTHFCELCHHKAGQLWDTKKEDILQCPCVSDKKTYLPKKVDIDVCPLGINHPPHGEEYCLGCAECRRLENERKDEDDDKDDSKDDNSEVNDINDDASEKAPMPAPVYDVDDDDESSKVAPGLFGGDDDSSCEESESESESALPNIFAPRKHHRRESSAEVPNLFDADYSSDEDESSEKIPNLFGDDVVSEEDESSVEIPNLFDDNLSSSEEVYNLFADDNDDSDDESSESEESSSE